MLTTSGPGGVPPVFPTSKLYPASAEQGVRVQSVQPGKYDSVDLSPEPVGERRSFLDFVSRLSREVRTATTTGDIQAFREQIHNGQYEPDPMSIAARIMLMEDVE